jgi:hypothetical protein
MERALYRLSAAWVLGAMLSVPHLAYAQDLSSDTAPSLCLDGMETVPIEDDLVPTEISVDGGCMVPETPVSI